MGGEEMRMTKKQSCKQTKRLNRQKWQRSTTVNKMTEKQQFPVDFTRYYKSMIKNHKIPVIKEKKNNKHLSTLIVYKVFSQ